MPFYDGGFMNVHVLKTYEEISDFAANMIETVMKDKPNAVLGLATGSTPVGVYKSLIAKNLDYKNVSTYNLDEYVGLEPTDAQSYNFYMKEHLFDHININPENTFVPMGNTADPHKEATEFEAKIDAAGGIDIQILGIGQNGHIGFNEPSDHFNKFTHVADLTESTIKANSIFFDKIEDVPTQAVSMGIGTIMKAKKIVLIATGAQKAQAIFDLMNGNVTPAVQASILNFHPDVTVLLDEAAASLLK